MAAERQFELDSHHLLRYNFAMSHCFGSVLDIACGYGEGSNMLSTSTKITNVVGVDIAQDVVDVASKRYPNIIFECANLLNYKGQFDSVVSFETVEHIKDFKKTKQQLKSLLKPKGLLIFSVPANESEGTNPHHVVWDLTQNDFEEFSECHFFHQTSNFLIKETFDEVSSVIYNLIGIYINK